MIDAIFKASGLTYRQGRYLNPPPVTYGIYFDDQTLDGPDAYGPDLYGLGQTGRPCIVRHDVMVELYEPSPDPDAEAAFEAELTARGILWTKEDRYWLQNAQRYQVIYNFTYYEKRRT